MLYSLLSHLLTVVTVRSEKPVPLAVDRWGGAPSDGVHFPMRVVVVHHVEISVPASAQTDKAGIRIG